MVELSDLFRYSPAQSRVQTTIERLPIPEHEQLGQGAFLTGIVAGRGTTLSGFDSRCFVP
jgi:hypothetical protein